MARSSERFISKHTGSIRFIFCPVSPTLRITNPTGPILFVLDYRDPWMSVSGSINPRVSITLASRVGSTRTYAVKICKKELLSNFNGFCVMVYTERIDLWTVVAN